MGLRDLVYRVYERRLEASLSGRSVPRHVGVILDGNRWWARSVGLAEVSSGYQKGVDHIVELLDWCRQAGVEVVTLWLLSTGYLARPTAEAGALLKIIEGAVRGLVAQGWHVKPVGALDLLPAETARVFKDAAEATAAIPGLLVNVAVGYGGRREIADAVRSLLQDHATKGASLGELAEILDVEHIAGHLYTAGQPDPDLVIRTSGEQRLGGFLLWQSAHSEFYFCDACWPAFRRADFLRALARTRRVTGGSAPDHPRAGATVKRRTGASGTAAPKHRQSWMGGAPPPAGQAPGILALGARAYRPDKRRAGGATDGRPRASRPCLSWAMPRR
jgi:short-chain Z-isoprenyl diphosphate synthase